MVPPAGQARPPLLLLLVPFGQKMTSTNGLSAAERVPKDRLLLLLVLLEAGEPGS